MEALRFIRFSKNRLLIPFIWIMYFVLCFRVLAKFPSNIFEILFLLVVGIVCMVSFRDMIEGWSKGKANSFQFILLPLFLLPFITALQANKEFNQPYWMGLFAQRQHFIIFAGYFLVIALKRKWIQLDQLKKYLIQSLFIIMFVMLFFSIFIDPMLFSDSEFVEFTLNKGWHYEFPSGIIANVIIYSMIVLLSTNNYKYLIPLAFGLFFFLIYLQDRSQLTMIFITLLIFYLRNVSLTRKLYYLVWGILLLSLLLGVVTIFAPDLISHYITIFGNASTIVTGDRTTEYSTNVRLAESAIAIKGFFKHPWFGNGHLSSQFNGGFSGIFGYFYASDIGILGNLFVYGILGTLLIYIPFFFTFKWIGKLRYQKDPLLTTAQYCMLFIFLDMITAASNIKYIGIPSIFFGIIYYYRFYVVDKDEHSTAPS